MYTLLEKKNHVTVTNVPLGPLCGGTVGWITEDVFSAHVHRATGILSEDLPPPNDWLWFCQLQAAHQKVTGWVFLLIEQGPLRGQTLLSSGCTADLQGWGSGGSLALRLHRVCLGLRLQGQRYVFSSLLQPTPVSGTDTYTTWIFVFSTCFLVVFFK